MFGSSLGIFDPTSEWNGVWIVAKPFFKWPGSKAWLINRFSHIFPGNSVRLVEPFAGSAAFYLGSTFQTALLADKNEQIVNCLCAVRDNPSRVLKYLSTLKNDRNHYIQIRDVVPVDAVTAAGRLIFLTNTSWGGLYRENKFGKFNVPFGNNGRKFFCEETILLASARLKRVDIQHASFEQSLKQTSIDDLIFIDAPYVTKSTSEFFDRYHMSRFCWADQIKLAQQLKEKNMSSKAMLITCAADPDLYELFDDWRIFEFSKRNSMTAHTNKIGYRREALLVSPALIDFAIQLEAQCLAAKVGQVLR